MHGGSVVTDMISFATRALADPSWASNPTVLKGLLKRAQESFEGAFGVLAAPMADLTWEIRMSLAGDTLQTNRTPLIYPRPCEIVGMLPIVVPTTATVGLITPTINDVDVQIDVNSEEYLTSGQGISSPAATSSAGAFVTLASMSIQTPRLLGKKLRQPQPNLGFIYRWKRGTGVYQDAFITTAVFARYL